MNGRFRTLAVLTSRTHRTYRLAVLAGLLAALAGCAKKEDTSSPPLPPTYSISGIVSGDVAAGVTVKIQGSSQSAVTDSLGRYSIGPVVNGTYTLVASRTGYSFTPSTVTVVVNGANVTRNFTSSLIPPPPPSWLIAGRVTGDDPGGVTLTLMGPQPATSTLTASSDVDGSYVLTTYVAGTYLVTPSRPGGWTFSPANALVTIAGASLSGPDFVSIAPVHAITGRVTGAFTAGVLVTLSGDADAFAVTDGTGNYAFAGLAPGNYVVTPSFPGYAFTPANRSVTMAISDVPGRDFAAAATHKVVGRITGDVLEGVKVTLSGAASGEATTDASGHFEIAGLRDGSYVLTPSLAGFLFGPAQRPVTLSGADVGGADFTASRAAAPTYTVSGSVTGAVQRGVTVTLRDELGDPAAVATTDGTGAYALQGVSPGTYLVIPSHDDYDFVPASSFVVVTTANVGGQVFTATVKPTARTITGTVAGDVIAGVTMTLTGPANQAAATDAAGRFAFRNLADGLYLVTPSAPGFVFTPANCLVRLSGPSVTSLQFASAFAPHSISGTITGPAVAGVLVALSGATTATTVTAADGTYTFTGLPNGDYVVTPELLGYYFSPAGAPVSLAGASAPGVDFVVAPSHRISGHVNGTPNVGVTVTAVGAGTGQATTDGTGFYEITDLRDGGYVVQASLDGFAYTPQSLVVDLAAADVTTADFAAVPTYTVSGTISGAASVAVSFTLSGPKSLSPNVNGGAPYAIDGLPNGSYMLIPSADGWVFAPASRAFRVDYGDVTLQDFTATPAP